MQKLIFLSDDFQDVIMQKKTHIPLMPLSPAFVYGKMYKNRRKHFVVLNGTKVMGNRVVYGTLYALDDFEHYSLALDALHDCTKGLLGYNHIMDEQHRVVGEVTLIKFETINDFLNAKVYETGTFPVQMYIGNINHPNIKKRINQKKRSFRVSAGVLPSFIKQWED